MKYEILAIVMALLVVNAVFYVTSDDITDEWIDQDDDDDDVIVDIPAITVNVPPIKAGDILHYDYDFLAETYEKNLTSGNWSRITLEANGQLLEQISGTANQRDGYDQAHQTWNLHTEIALSVKITYVEYREGEDNEPLIVLGRLEGGRDRHATLKGDVPIMNYAGGILAIDEIKGLDMPISNFEFSIDNWAYPDPTIAPDRTLEEQLYGEQATLSEGMNGTVGEFNEAWNYTQLYNWSIDRSGRVRGYDCARLNISLDFFGFLKLEKFIWLSSDVPRPVGIEYNSSTFWAEENSTGHLILNTSQILQSNGYTPGSTVVPIRNHEQEGFYDRHPQADFRAWDHAPADGSITGSSFDFGLEEALDHAIANSPALQDWIEDHPNAMVDGASYGANNTEALTTEYTWNISLADETWDWENESEDYDTNGYSVNVTKSIRRRPILGDEIETFIASEHGTYRTAAALERNTLSSTMLTLGSSESVWSRVSRVTDEAYTGIEQDVDFTSASYYYGVGGLDFAGGFGMDLLDTLAGVSIPNAHVSWSLQVGTVWEGAKTTMVQVDAETGRIVLISKVSGPQSLMLIFGA